MKWVCFKFLATPFGAHSVKVLIPHVLGWFFPAYATGWHYIAVLLVPFPTHLHLLFPLLTDVPYMMCPYVYKGRTPLRTTPWYDPLIGYYAIISVGGCKVFSPLNTSRGLCCSIMVRNLAEETCVYRSVVLTEL